MSDTPAPAAPDQPKPPPTAEDIRARDLADLAEVMSQPAGRRFIWRLLSAAGIFRISFAGEAPLTMAFNEGRRNEGTALFADLQESCPELYHRMAQEAKNDAVQA